MSFTVYLVSAVLVLVFSGLLAMAGLGAGVKRQLNRLFTNLSESTWRVNSPSNYRSTRMPPFPPKSALRCSMDRALPPCPSI